jgi:hypothetical protein
MIGLFVCLFVGWLVGWFVVTSLGGGVGVDGWMVEINLDRKVGR